MKNLVSGCPLFGCSVFGSLLNLRTSQTSLKDAEIYLKAKN
jgi:hypothetical protein